MTNFQIHSDDKLEVFGRNRKTGEVTKTAIQTVAELEEVFARRADHDIDVSIGIRGQLEFAGSFVAKNTRTGRELVARIPGVPLIAR